jgi:hypothetical protein
MGDLGRIVRKRVVLRPLDLAAAPPEPEPVPAPEPAAVPGTAPAR